MAFFEIIFPVIFIITIGYLLNRVVPDLELKTLSRITMFILTPSLIFTSLLQTKVTPQDAGIMFIFTICLTLGIYLISMVSGKVMRLSKADQNGLYLATIFLNAGNFGIPVALFAFGTAGMEREVIMLVFQNLLVSTLGVYFASASHRNWRDALKKVFQLPPFYALLAAFLIRIFQIELPVIVIKPISLMGSGAVPVLLLTLGIQLSRTKLGKHLQFISVASIIRLIISPVLAFGLIHLLGVSGLTAKIMILAAATPTAVSATLYSIEFNASPAKVSAVTFATTILSTITVTVLLSGFLLK